MFDRMNNTRLIGYCRTFFFVEVRCNNVVDVVNSTVASRAQEVAVESFVALDGFQKFSTASFPIVDIDSRAN
jgi:hypothetical protein